MALCTCWKGAFDEHTTWASRPEFGAKLLTFHTEDDALRLDVSSTVRAWAEGREPYGFGLRSSGVDGADFASSENARTADRPRLVVEYR